MEDLFRFAASRKAEHPPGSVGRARSWTRLGLLCLRDGVWKGERLLPGGFARFVARPAPAWDEPLSS